MSLTFWNRTPILDEFARTRDEMDRMLGRFLGTTLGTTVGAPESRLARGEGWLPPVDVSESDEEVMVRAEVPGMNARDIEITIAGSTLNITGRKQEKEECEQEDFYRCERRFGAFRRVIELPQSVEADKARAESDSGIVTVRIPKRPDVRPRSIEIKPAPAGRR